MKDKIAHYTIAQYERDSLRKERVNIGIILLLNEMAHGKFLGSTIRTYLFPSNKYLKQIGEEVIERISRAELDNMYDLEKYIKTRCNDLQYTPLTAFKVNSKDSWVNILDELYDKIVK